MRMPFGKHAGKMLTDVPASYLVWLLAECDQLRPSLRQAAEEELRRRDNPTPSPDPSRTGLVDVRGLPGQVHREMALRFHPDRGGSIEAMAAINTMVDRLKALLPT